MTQVLKQLIKVHKDIQANPVPARPVHAKRAQLIKQAVANGTRQVDIARTLGITRERVRQLVVKAEAASA